MRGRLHTTVAVFHCNCACRALTVHQKRALPVRRSAHTVVSGLSFSSQLQRGTPGIGHLKGPASGRGGLSVCVSVFVDVCVCCSCRFARTACPHPGVRTRTHRALPTHARRTLLQHLGFVAQQPPEWNALSPSCQILHLAAVLLSLPCDDSHAFSSLSSARVQASEHTTYH